MPVRGHNFIEEMPGLEMPTGRAAILAENSNRAGVVPSQHHENAGLELCVMGSGLHVLSDRLHERALVSKPYFPHTGVGQLRSSNQA